MHWMQKARFQKQQNHYYVQTRITHQIWLISILNNAYIVGIALYDKKATTWKPPCMLNPRFVIWLPILQTTITVKTLDIVMRPCIIQQQRLTLKNSVNCWYVLQHAISVWLETWLYNLILFFFTEQVYDSLFLLFSKCSHLQLLSSGLHNSSFLVSCLPSSSSCTYMSRSILSCCNTSTCAYEWYQTVFRIYHLGPYIKFPHLSSCPSNNTMWQ